MGEARTWVAGRGWIDDANLTVVDRAIVDDYVELLREQVEPAEAAETAATAHLGAAADRAHLWPPTVIREDRLSSHE